MDRLKQEYIGGFSIFHIDPPWNIAKSPEAVYRGVGLDYALLDDSALLTVNFGHIANENSIAFLWCVESKMSTALKMLELNNFGYVETIYWKKDTSRPGNLLRRNMEMCLVGERGDRTKFRRNLGCNMVEAPALPHSRKPQPFWNLVNKIYQGTDRIDLFTSPEGLQAGWVGVGIQPRIRRILASPPTGGDQDLSRGMLAWDRTPVMYTFEDETAVFLKGYNVVKVPEPGQDAKEVKRMLEEKDEDVKSTTVIEGCKDDDATVADGDGNDDKMEVEEKEDDKDQKQDGNADGDKKDGDKDKDTQDANKGDGTADKDKTS